MFANTSLGRFRKKGTMSIFKKIYIYFITSLIEPLLGLERKITHFARSLKKGMGKLHMLNKTYKKLLAKFLSGLQIDNVLILQRNVVTSNHIVNKKKVTYYVFNRFQK